MRKLYIVPEADVLFHSKQDIVTASVEWAENGDGDFSYWTP